MRYGLHAPRLRFAPRLRLWAGLIQGDLLMTGLDALGRRPRRQGRSHCEGFRLAVGLCLVNAEHAPVGVKASHPRGPGAAKRVPDGSTPLFDLSKSSRRFTPAGPPAAHHLQDSK